MSLFEETVFLDVYTKWDWWPWIVVAVILITGTYFLIPDICVPDHQGDDA